MYKLFAFITGIVVVRVLINGFLQQQEMGTSQEFIRLIRSTKNASLLGNWSVPEGGKWIVVTSVQLPTPNVKRLASLPGWTVVVVADKKTPTDWHLDGVHFLSVEDQENLASSLPTIAALPYKSYTRKNIGYLYAIAHGAEWIYDTDDDNVPFDRGLDEFNYEERITGLRFQMPDGAEPTNVSMQDRLFNPYRHFGVPSIWPRGFPLEQIEGHVHQNGFYRSCATMRRAAVQQGIVRTDPDVDAIYRLLHADKATGLHVEFHPFAPTATLAPGMYSPWNSQNTLFHRSAFFGLFLPTTVAFRVTDIWRSFFTQALLHTIGESVSFVAVNAVQVRNAHNYLKDFEEELDVYTKSGEIIEFLSQWKCNAETTEECMEELASLFASRGYWGKDDEELVTMWIRDLNAVGYVFPEHRDVDENEYAIDELKVLPCLGKQRYCDIPFAQRTRNCRRAHWEVTMTVPRGANDTKEIEKRAEQKIQDFADIQGWCTVAKPVGAQNWTFPSVDDEAKYVAATEGLLQKYQMVGIVTNNFPWSFGMGLIQRLYEASFGMLIFCGTYHPGMLDKKDASFPKMRDIPITYVDLAEAEMNHGLNGFYCLNKVHELRLRNVKGFVMFSDDLIFNQWYNLDFGKIYTNHRYNKEYVKQWWTNRPFAGINAAKQSVKLLTQTYAHRPEVILATETYNQLIAEANYSWDGKVVTDIANHITTMDSWCMSDLVYIPASNMTFFTTLSEIFYEAGLFHEIVFSKFMAIMPNSYQWQEPNEMVALLGNDRSKWTTLYNDKLAGLHPIKFSGIISADPRRTYCNTVLDVVHKNQFGHHNKLKQ